MGSHQRDKPTKSIGWRANAYGPVDITFLIGCELIVADAKLFLYQQKIR